MAPHPGRRDPHGRPQAQLAARPADSTAGTGSTAARPTSSSRPSTTTTTRSDRRGRVEEGYHLSADLADRAIAQLGDLRAVDVDRPLLPLLLPPGPATRPTTRPAEWIERYRGRFDDGWDRVARARPSPGSWSSGLFPQGAVLSARPPWVPAWDDLPGRGAAGRRPVHGVLRRFPVLHRRPDSPGVRLPRPDRATSTTRSSSWCRTTAPAPKGGPTGRSTTTASRTSTPPAPRSCERASTSSGAPSPTTTTRGAGRWPATRRSSGGSGRSTRAAWPTRASCAGRPRLGVGGGVRHQFTHAVDVLPTVLELAGIEPPGDHRVRAAVPYRRHQLRLAARAGGADAPPHARTQHFEMFGSRALYHDGWKAVTFKPIGPLYNDGLNWNAPFSEDRWELYHVAEDPTEIHDLAARRSRPAGRHDRAVVGRGRGRTRSCRSTTGSCTPWSTPSPIAGRPR